MSTIIVAASRHCAIGQAGVMVVPPEDVEDGITESAERRFERRNVFGHPTDQPYSLIVEILDRHP